MKANAVSQITFWALFYASLGLCVSIFAYLELRARYPLLQYKPIKRGLLLMLCWIVIVPFWPLFILLGVGYVLSPPRSTAHEHTRDTEFGMPSFGRRYREQRCRNVSREWPAPSRTEAAAPAQAPGQVHSEVLAEAKQRLAVRHNGPEAPWYMQPERPQGFSYRSMPTVSTKPSCPAVLHHARLAGGCGLHMSTPAQRVAALRRDLGLPER